MEEPRVTGVECDCELCRTACLVRAEDKCKFDWKSVAVDFKFSVVNDPEGKGNTALGKIAVPEAKSEEDFFGNVISFLTYFDPYKKPLSLREYIAIGELLFVQDLEEVIKDRRLALNFLSKITRLFVVAWYAVTVHRNKTAVWAACLLRRLLVHIIQFPIISSEVALVFFTAENWPVMGPLQIIERLTMDHLFCTDTLFLLANLTRISNVSNLLARDTLCLEIIQEEFLKCCNYVQKHDDRGNLLLTLFINLAWNDDFLRFLICRLQETKATVAGRRVRAFILDILYNLCRCKPSLIKLRECKVPAILKHCQLTEENKALNEKIEDLMNIISRNEDTEIEVDEVMEDLTLSSSNEELDPPPSPAMAMNQSPELEPLKNIQIMPQCSLLLLKRRLNPSKVVLEDDDGDTDLKVIDQMEDLALSPSNKELEASSKPTEDQSLELVEAPRETKQMLQSPTPPLKRRFDPSKVVLEDDGDIDLEVDHQIEDFTLSPSNKELEVSLNPAEDQSLELVEAPRETKQMPESPTPPLKRRFDPSKVVLEDDDGLASGANPCTFEATDCDKKPFDYHRFGEFNRMRALLFQAQRRKQRLLDKAKGIRTDNKTPPKKPAEPSQAFLMNKFSEVYGPTNFDTPEMQKRLQVMKETMMEMANMEPEHHECLTLFADEDIRTGDPIICEQEVISEINARFLSEDQLKYGKLDPCESDGDWFVIPRPPLCETRKKYFDQFADGQFSKIPSRKKRAGSQLDLEPVKKLHVYDPKAEYCLNMPYRVFKLGDKSIPRRLSAQVINHLNRFPLGITVSVFWKTFCQANKYMPRVRDGCGLDDIFHQHMAEFFVAAVGLRTIYFPGELTGVIHPETVLQRLWHITRCLLSENGFCIATNEIFETIKLRYGFEFDVRNWGFSDVNDFLIFILEKFGYKKDLVVYRVSFTLGNVNTYVDYLAINCPKFTDQLNHRHGVSVVDVRKEKELKKPIPKRYLKEGSRIPAISNNLLAGNTIIVDLKSIQDPERMSAINIEDYNGFWKFHELVQKLESKYACQSPPDPRRLQIGMYLMAYLKWGSFGPYWFRVRILWQHDVNNSYLVFGIDCGFWLYTKLENLRYMPRLEIGSELAHCVPLKMLGVENTKGRDGSYNSSVMNKIMKRYMKDENGDLLKINLVEGHFSQTLGCRHWTVTIDVIEKTTLRLLQPSIHQQFPKDYAVEIRKAAKRNLAKKLKLAKEKEVKEAKEKEAQEAEGKELLLMVEE